MSMTWVNLILGFLSCAFFVMWLSERELRKMNEQMKDHWYESSSKYLDYILTQREGE